MSAQVRQNKESLSQARIDVDVRRDQVRQAVTAAWTQYKAAQETVSATREVVKRRAARAQWRRRGAQCRPAHHA